MSKISDFIKVLSDHELAIFVGCQYESFLTYSREEVINEIKERNLTKDQLVKYFKTKLSYNEQGRQCERCGSNKFYTDTDTEFRNGRFTTTFYEVQTNRCRLCNYNPSKSLELNIFKRIKNYFVFDKNKKSIIIKTYDWLDN